MKITITGRLNTCSFILIINKIIKIIKL